MVIWTWVKRVSNCASKIILHSFLKKGTEIPIFFKQVNSKSLILIVWELTITSFLSEFLLIEVSNCFCKELDQTGEFLGQ